MKAVPISSALNNMCSGRADGPYVEPTFSIAEAVLHANAYDDMSYEPTAEVLASYASLRKELAFQMELALDAGFHFIPSSGDEEYTSSDQMRGDLAGLSVNYLRTSSNEGTISELPEGHPFAGTVSLANGELWVWNDVFRVVHDIFAHGIGNSFSAKGEHQAWLAHRRIMPRAAHHALWCETKGQNSWVNFGPHVFNQDIPVADRPYAPQKIGHAPVGLII